MRHDKMNSTMSSPFLKIGLILTLCSLGLWACQGGQIGGFSEGLEDALEAASEDAGGFPEEATTANSGEPYRPPVTSTPIPGGGDDPGYMDLNPEERVNKQVEEPKPDTEAEAVACFILDQDGNQTQIDCPPDSQLESPPAPLIRNKLYLTNDVSK